MKTKVILPVVLVGLLIFVAILFFWYRQNHPTDSMIRHRLAGAWSESLAGGRSRTFVFGSDGHWTFTITGKIGNGNGDGIWEIKNGVLITTVTNNDMGVANPSTSTAQVIRIDSHGFVLQVSRNNQIICKKVEP